MKRLIILLTAAALLAAGVAAKKGERGGARGDFLVELRLVDVYADARNHAIASAFAEDACYFSAVCKNVVWPFQQHGWRVGRHEVHYGFTHG